MITIFARSDTATTIYFIMQFCLASIQEQLLFKSGIFKIRTEDEEIYCLKEGGVTADTRESEETLPRLW